MGEHAGAALEELGRALPKQALHAPSKAARPGYGARVQHAEDGAAPRKLTKDEAKRAQKVAGKFLLLARAIGNAMLHALSEIACDASDGAEKALEAAAYLLSYIACSPRPKARLHASGMALQAGSGAALQARPEARSRAGGYHYLGSKNNGMFNAPILVVSKVIKPAMGSAAEAEVAAIHLSAKEAASARQCLEEMGHPQPATRMRAGNAAAQGFANGTIK